MHATLECSAIVSEMAYINILYLVNVVEMCFMSLTILSRQVFL